MSKTGWTCPKYWNTINNTNTSNRVKSCPKQVNASQTFKLGERQLCIKPKLFKHQPDISSTVLFFSFLWVLALHALHWQSQSHPCTYIVYTCSESDTLDHFSPGNKLLYMYNTLCQCHCQYDFTVTVERTTAIISVILKFITINIHKICCMKTIKVL